VNSRIKLEGQKIQGWSVLSYEYTKDKIAYYACECECGKKEIVRGYNLRSGRSKGCKDCGRKRTTAALFGQDRSKYSAKDYTLRRLMKDYKQRSAKKGFPFELGFEQFKHLTSQNCHYCGIAPSTLTNRVQDGKTVPKARVDQGWVYMNGIDRVDSSRGYSLDNIVTCCETCNKAKLDSSVQDFRSWIERVYKNLNKGLPSHGDKVG
jgi:5-methylcytosine-specific restriction endonuclease McrA